MQLTVNSSQRPPQKKRVNHSPTFLGGKTKTSTEPDSFSRTATAQTTPKKPAIRFGAEDHMRNYQKMRTRLEELNTKHTDDDAKAAVPEIIEYNNKNWGDYQTPGYSSLACRQSSLTDMIKKTLKHRQHHPSIIKALVNDEGTDNWKSKYLALELSNNLFHYADYAHAENAFIDTITTLAKDPEPAIREHALEAIDAMRDAFNPSVQITRKQKKLLKLFANDSDNAIQKRLKEITKELAPQPSSGDAGGV